MDTTLYCTDCGMPHDICDCSDDDIFQDKEEFTAPIPCEYIIGTAPNPVPIPCEYIIGTDEYFQHVYNLVQHNPPKQK